jgi:hypothetical protein
MSLTRTNLVTAAVLVLTALNQASTAAADTIPLAEVGRDSPTTLFQAPVEHLYRLAFAPGEKMFAVGCFKQPIVLFDFATGKEIRRLKHENVSAFAFSPDGQYLAALDIYHDPDRISLWMPASGKPLPPVKMTAAEQGKHIQFLDANTLGVVTTNQRGACLHLWDVALGKELRRFDVPDVVGAYGNLFWPCAFSPDHRTFLISDGKGGVHRFDIASGKELKKLVPGKREASVDRTLALAVSPDGNCLATAEQMSVSLPDVPAAPGQGLPGAFAFRPPPPWPGKQDTTRHFVGINLWDLTTGRELIHWEAEACYGMTFSPDGRTLASRGTSTMVLWETASGKQRRVFPETQHWSGPKFVTFFHSDKRVLWADGAGRALAYDMTGVTRAGQARTVVLSEKERDVLWEDLASADAGRGFRAVQALSAAPQQSIPLIQERLPRLQGVDEKQLARWIAELDHQRFAVREKAQRELEKLGTLAKPALRKALADAPSLELRRRADLILPKLDGGVPPERLSVVRSLEVLENLGSAEARKVLQFLAKGEDSFGRAEEARRTLERLK